jgi:hypothetical protein
VPADRRRDHGVGPSLLAPPATRARITAGWDRLGTWTDDAVVSLPLQGWLGPPDVLDLGCHRIDGERARLAAHAFALRCLHEKTRRPLR